MEIPNEKIVNEEEIMVGLNVFTLWPSNKRYYRALVTDAKKPPTYKRKTTTEGMVLPRALY